MTQKIKYETPNLRIREFNVSKPEGEALDRLAALLGLKRRFLGFETDSMFYNRYRLAQLKELKVRK
jgi:hypothetical protein